MKGGREKRARTTNEKTLAGSPKVPGRKNALQGPHGPAIRAIFQPFVNNGMLNPSDNTKIVKALWEAEIAAESGTQLQHKSVRQWFDAILREQTPAP